MGSRQYVLFHLHKCMRQFWWRNSVRFPNHSSTAFGDDVSYPNTRAAEWPRWNCIERHRIVRPNPRKPIHSSFALYPWRSTDWTRDIRIGPRRLACNRCSTILKWNETLPFRTMRSLLFVMLTHMACNSMFISFKPAATASILSSTTGVVNVVNRIIFKFDLGRLKPHNRLALFNHTVTQ